MKTLNNNQKRSVRTLINVFDLGRKGLAVVTTIVLLSFCLDAQNSDNPESEKYQNANGKVKVFMLSSSSTVQTETTMDVQMNILEEKDQELKLENWMIKKNYFKSTPEINVVVEKDQKLELEEWMLETNYFAKKEPNQVLLCEK